MALGFFRRGVGAAFVLGLLLVASAEAAAPESLLPPLRSVPTVQPTPTPAPSAGRIPVRLRLADTISMKDAPHPPAATTVRFDLDRHYRLDLSGTRACKELQGRQPGRDASPCEGVEEIGRGTIMVEALFPEEEPITVQGKALAYKRGPGALVVWAYLPAPVTGSVLIPVKIGSYSAGRYGSKLTATIPQIAGGAGSLTYLGLRFRKGLFSLACPNGSLQSRVTSSFVDGERASGGLIQTC